MKILRYYIAIVILMMGMSSCYEEEFFLDDNTTTEGKHFPVIQTVEIEGDNNEGETINLNMHYWSEDPVLHHELYAAVGSGTESLYSTTDYTYNYDSETGGELVSLPYTIPAGSSGEVISFRIVVVNENELTRETTAEIEVN